MTPLPTSKLSPLSRSSGPKGFAIIVTVSILVLLAVIAVGLLTLSSVTLRTSGEGQALSEAQANARLALILAIGDLQKHLGPDQRINAPANLTDASLDPSRGHWVGVWNSWPADQLIAPSTSSPAG